MGKFETVERPMVSIIIPTYNREDRIIDTLDSVFRQSYKNIEVVIVDDGSIDSTTITIEKFIVDNKAKNIKLIKQENRGAPAARNNGFKNSIGKLIVFFDSDDIMLGERINLQVEEIQKSNSDMCACGFFFDKVGGQSYVPVDLKNPLIQNIKRELWGSTQSWMFRRSIVERINGFDEDLKCKQDLDIVFRALIESSKVCIVKLPCSVFVRHDGKERIMKSTKNLNGLDSILKFNFKVINYCLQINNKPLYKTSIRNLADDLYQIMSVPDIFSKDFISKLNTYLTLKSVTTRYYLYCYLMYKLCVSDNFRKTLRAFIKR